jgi:chemotaxis protein MotB
MKILQLIAVLIVTGTMMTACVSTKKFNAKDAELQKAKTDLNDCQTNVAKAQISNKKLTEQVKDLTTQAEDAKAQLDAANAKLAAGNSSDLLTTLKNLNVLTPDQASSIDQSLKAVGSENKETLNATLINNLKASIGGANDTDIVVSSDKGSLYVDLTDHMFFNSGSADLTPRAKMIIEKLAKILNSYPDMHFMVEGHTDNKPISTACVPDNWELSIRRATAVVRMLQKTYKVDPSRMIAAGHSEYEPIASNDTPAHRAQNRRISIVMTPQLDQFFKLLVKK